MVALRWFFVVYFVFAIAGSVAPEAADTWPATNDEIPPGYSGPIFKPSFAFPASAPENEPRPWEKFDFKTQPRAYLEAVLAYVYEGMDKSTWRVQDNPVRKWYHVPWMHAGKDGREFIHGLTRERASKPGELGPGLKRCVQNWAVGFYNPPGGMTLNQIWGDGSQPPDPSRADFPVGTVAAKLAFTHATPEEVPFLKGAPAWRANINDPSVRDHRGCPVHGKRKIQTVRLLQFDVAVRDARADSTTGWVFGTFAYNAEKGGDDPWARLEPVGLMWGNDPDLSDQDAAKGAKPRQGIVLSTVGLNRNFGRGGRMNGLIDTKWSSCLSCHMSAQYPSASHTMTAPASMTSWDQIGCWFRNLKPRQAYGYAPVHGHTCGEGADRMQSQNYSQSLAVALRAYAAANPSTTGAAYHPSVAKSPGTEELDVHETLVIDGVTSIPVKRSSD